MQELFFVLKTLVITCLVIFAMQFKVGENTIETQANHFLKSSSVALYMRDAAHGLIKGFNNLNFYLQEKISGIKTEMSSFTEAKNNTKRSIFEFERSDAYKKAHSDE